MVWPTKVYDRVSKILSACDRPCLTLLCQSAFLWAFLWAAFAYNYFLFSYLYPNNYTHFTATTKNASSKIRKFYKLTLIDGCFLMHCVPVVKPCFPILFNDAIPQSWQFLLQLSRSIGHASFDDFLICFSPFSLYVRSPSQIEKINCP